MSRHTRKHPKRKIREKDINKTIDEVIADFANEKFKQGIEGLKELANWFKSAGATQQSFLDLCQYIENEASQFHDDPSTLRLEIGKQIRLAFIGTRKNGVVYTGNMTQH